MCYKLFQSLQKFAILGLKLFEVQIDFRDFTEWKVSESRVFWPVFSCIRTEYESKSPSSVQMRENAEQKKLRILTLFTQRSHLRK